LHFALPRYCHHRFQMWVGCHPLGKLHRTPCGCNYLNIQFISVLTDRWDGNTRKILDSLQAISETLWYCAREDEK
jgi:hypothetical protein